VVHTYTHARAHTHTDLYGAHNSELSLSVSVSNHIKQVGFKMLFNTAKLKPGCRSADGRLFHMFGLEAEKLLSPNGVFARGTTQVLVSAERR